MYVSGSLFRAEDLFGYTGGVRKVEIMICILDHPTHPVPKNCAMDGPFCQNFPDPGDVSPSWESESVENDDFVFLCHFVNLKGQGWTSGQDCHFSVIFT